METTNAAATTDTAPTTEVTTTEVVAEVTTAEPMEEEASKPAEVGSSYMKPPRTNHFHLHRVFSIKKTARV